MQNMTQLPVELKANPGRWTLCLVSSSLYISSHQTNYMQSRRQFKRPSSSLIYSKFKDVTILLYAKNLKTLTKGSIWECIMTRLRKYWGRWEVVNKASICH